MTFQVEKVADFLSIFESSKDKIRHFEGCCHLELLRDLDCPHIFSTYSHWENEQALEKYRQSELFRKTWAASKILFAEKPLAFSNQVFMSV